MKKKRLNVAASVVAQANIRASLTPQNVLNHTEHSASTENKPLVDGLYSRIDQSPDPETDCPRLLVIFPGGEKPEIYNFTELLVQPEIAKFLAEGFRHWTASLSPLSRKNAGKNLRRYICEFLKTLQAPCQLADIDEAFWASFLLWVNGPRKKNGQPWAEASRARIHGSFRMCMEALIEHPRWGTEANYLLNHSGFPRKPWRGRSAKVIPRKVMSPTERQAIIVACLSELAELRARLDERDKILMHGRASLMEAKTERRPPPYREEIGVCAAQIAEVFSEKLASMHDLYDYDRSLGVAVDHTHRMLSVRRLLYPTFRDLVPFVVLIAMKSAFNADTTLSLSWSRVRINSDKRTVTFLGTKGRAKDLQVSINAVESFINDVEVPSEPDVPSALADLLTLLRRITVYTSPLLADVDQKDRLFVAVPKKGTVQARPFYIAPGDSGGTLWWGVLQDFIKTHNLTPFGLSNLRSTEGEIEWGRTGDLFAVRDRLGNKSIATTRTHYTSGGMRRESQERVAEVQALYQRWSKSEGRIDPRTQTESWRSSATPGFGCMQPYDSPRLGQRKGRLCDAYGECPDCPLAQAWPQDVQAATYYIALEKAIYDARLGRIPARQWVEKWPSVLIALDKLLSAIPSEIRAEASRFSIVLKPVG